MREKSLSPLDRERFRVAKEVEWKTVLEEKKAVRLLSKEESRKVFADPNLSERVIPSRFALN